MRERTNVVFELRKNCAITTYGATLNFAAITLDDSVEDYAQACWCDAREIEAGLRDAPWCLGYLWKIEAAAGPRVGTSRQQTFFLHPHFDVAVKPGTPMDALDRLLKSFSTNVLTTTSDNGWTDYLNKGFTDVTKWNPNVLRAFRARLNCWWECVGRPKFYGFGGVFNGNVARGPKRLAELFAALDDAAKGSWRKRANAMRDPFMALLASDTRKWMERVPPIRRSK